jgi:hypothetical protein
MADKHQEELIAQIDEASSYLNGALVDARKLADRIARGTGGREVSLAITNLQQAGMWLKQAAAEIDAVGKPTTGEEKQTV